jgi:hypothetical protein
MNGQRVRAPNLARCAVSNESEASALSSGISIEVTLRSGGDEFRRRDRRAAICGSAPSSQRSSSAATAERSSLSGWSLPRPPGRDVPAFFGPHNWVLAPGTVKGRTAQIPKGCLSCGRTAVACQPKLRRRWKQQEVRLRNWRCYGGTPFALDQERRLVAGARSRLYRLRCTSWRHDLAERACAGPRLLICCAEGEGAVA